MLEFKVGKQSGIELHGRKVVNVRSIMQLKGFNSGYNIIMRGSLSSQSE